jgi:hypothetical protein
MGDLSRVTQAVSAVGANKDIELIKLSKLSPQSTRRTQRQFCKKINSVRSKKENSYTIKLKKRLG